MRSLTFLLILCKASKSAKSSNFIFLFDWFKRNADWRVQQTVVAREQEYTDWKPSLDICKMLCFGHVAACFLSKRFYILDTCIIFHEIMFFKELLAFRALYFIQGAFILFRALYFSCIAPFCSCIALYLIFCVSQHLLIFSNCESARYFTFLPNCHVAILSVKRLSLD